MELLYHALPPPLSYLNLDENSSSCRGNDLAPEGLRRNVGWHLTYFPRAWVIEKDMQRQGAADP